MSSELGGGLHEGDVQAAGATSTLREGGHVRSKLRLPG